MNKWFTSFNGKMDAYRSAISNSSQARDVVDSFLEQAVNKKIFLYEAGTIGRNLVRLLRAMHIMIHGIFDQKAATIREIGGYSVSGVNQIINQCDNSDTVCIVAVNRNQFSAIRNFLMESGLSDDQIVNGHDLHIVLQSAWCMLQASSNDGSISPQDCWECTVLDNQCKSLRQYLMRINHFNAKESSGTEKLFMIGYILGNVCTLKCKNCCECVPYFEKEKRNFVSSEEVIRDIKKLSASSKFLTLLEFVGGEPFLHPELAIILKSCLSIRNIGVIHIFTNGTVIPSDRLCEVLSDKKISVYLSNYQASLEPCLKERCDSTEKKLKEYGIQFFRGKKESWSDFRSFRFIEKTEEQLTQGFSDCFLHNCNRLYKGRLFVCPHQYAGLTLGELTTDNETINIHEYSKIELEAKLVQFRSLRYIDACRHCKMPYNAEPALSGEQLP